MVRLKGINKKRMTVTVDISLLDKIQKMNINVSKIVNDSLKDYINKI